MSQWTCPPDSKNFCGPLGAVPLLCDDVLVEIGLVADHENAAFVVHERPLELRLGVHVEVIGGLVEDQKVGGATNQFAEADFGLLAAGEDADFALDMLRCEAAFGERRTDFVLREAGEFLPDLFDAGRVCVLAHFLFKISNFQILSRLNGARKGGDEAKEALEERRFSDAVGAGEDDAAAALHRQVERGGERLVVSDDQIPGDEQELTRRLGVPEVELRLGLFDDLVKSFHFVELFLPRHGHISCRDARLVAGDKVFELGGAHMLPAAAPAARQKLP